MDNWDSVFYGLSAAQGRELAENLAKYAEILRARIIEDSNNIAQKEAERLRDEEQSFWKIRLREGYDPKHVDAAVRRLQEIQETAGLYRTREEPGGSNNPGNPVILCEDCHKKIHPHIDD